MDDLKQEMNALRIENKVLRELLKSITKMASIKDVDKHNHVEGKRILLMCGNLLSDYDLSARCFNMLRAAQVHTIGDLIQLEISDLMKFRNMGKKSLTELEAFMLSNNIQFGTKLAKMIICR